MHIRGMVDDQVQNHLQPQRMGAVQHPPELAERAVIRMDIPIVRNVIAIIGVGGGIDGGYWFFMRGNFISPLMRIRRNVTEFAQNDTATTTSLESIRTKDEIQDLAESISLMENDIIRYIGSIRTITAEKERIGAELSIATRIQADMLPRTFPPTRWRRSI